MRRLLATALLSALLAAPAFAHPGVGIVMDAHGNVYYTDLHHVWRIAPDGTKSLAVPNVHTHELHLDADGNLYGEHLWYEGEATDRWGHRVWRLSPDGTLIDVIPATEGFLTNYSFVRDRSGTMYWADRGERTVIRKRLPDGRVIPHAAREFHDVRWMTSTPDGTLYLIDDGDLKRVRTDGVVETVARDLRQRSLRSLLSPTGLVSLILPFGGRHDVQGLWADSRGNVYVAVTAERQVKRVGPDGRVRVVARTRFPWSPTGGLVTPDGDLWILEYSVTNRARVRRIRTDGRSIVY